MRHRPKYNKYAVVCSVLPQDTKKMFFEEVTDL